jgi:hypothetical protein
MNHFLSCLKLAINRSSIIIIIIILATAFVTTLTRQRGSSGHSQMGSEQIQHSYTIWNHLLEKPTCWFGQQNEIHSSHRNDRFPYPTQILPRLQRRPVWLGFVLLRHRFCHFTLPCLTPLLDLKTVVSSSSKLKPSSSSFGFCEPMTSTKNEEMFHSIDSTKEIKGCLLMNLTGFVRLCN